MFFRRVPCHAHCSKPRVIESLKKMLRKRWENGLKKGVGKKGGKERSHVYEDGRVRTSIRWDYRRERGGIDHQQQH